MSNETFHSIRSIDIKKIEDRFKDKTGFCKSINSCTSNTTGYVFSANKSTPPNAVSAIVMDQDISNCLQLRNTVYSISDNIQSNSKKHSLQLHEILYISKMNDPGICTIITWIVSTN